LWPTCLCWPKTMIQMVWFYTQLVSYNYIDWQGCQLVVNQNDWVTTYSSQSKAFSGLILVIF
jgi:hypothetical protein